MPDIAVYPVVPHAKPRLTRGDSITMAKLRGRQRLNQRETKRAAALGKWLAYCDEVQLRRVRLDLEGFYHVVFCVPMPASWSQKKKTAHDLRIHRARPDRDNLDKALMDACHAEDCISGDARVTKIWARRGAIIISRHNLHVTPAVLGGILEQTNYGNNRTTKFGEG